MTKSDLFDTAFNERAFCAFITKLLPDFQKERRPIITQGILNHARLLGVSEVCQTAVIVVHVDIKSSRRKLQITREAFRILRLSLPFILMMKLGDFPSLHQSQKSKMANS